MGVLSPTQWLLGGISLIRKRGVERVLGVLMNESDEVLERAIAVIVDEVTGTSFLKLDSWETGDTETGRRGDIVFSGLHLGTGQTGVGVEGESVSGNECVRKTYIVILSLKLEKFSPKESHVGPRRLQ